VASITAMFNLWMMANAGGYAWLIILVPSIQGAVMTLILRQGLQPSSE
jgi:hypothetical protein